MIAPTPQRFKTRFLQTLALSSLDGIEKYLGCGPVYAKKMVKGFSEKVFDVIEAEPGRLREVKGHRRDSRIGCIETEPAVLPLQMSVSPRHRINSDGALGQAVSLAIECRRMNKRIERQRAFTSKVHAPLLGLRLPVPVPLRQDFGGPPPQAERVV